MNSLAMKTKTGYALPTNKRIYLFALACCIQAIYVPTSFRISGGIEPKLSIDVFPIWPVWVVPYVSCYLLWFFSFVWVILKMDDHSFRALIAGCFLSFAIGTSTFVFFPTYVRQAALEGNDIFSSILRFIHENWGRYDAFPSGHVYITTLLAFFYNRWYPHRKVLWISIVTMVSLSTLFTGQHYVVDVLGGFVVALTGYRFGLWWTGSLPARNRLN